jgi:hypothetical protein
VLARRTTICRVEPIYGLAIYDRIAGASIGNVIVFTLGALFHVGAVDQVNARAAIDCVTVEAAS